MIKAKTMKLIMADITGTMQMPLSVEGTIFRIPLIPAMLMDVVGEVQEWWQLRPKQDTRDCFHAHQKVA